MGVDPGRTRLPHNSTVNEEADKLERELLQAALPILGSLRSSIHAASLFLTLTSKFGRNFHREGNRITLRSADNIDLVSGALTDDDLIGTNGAGTALRLKRGIVVDLNEHYCEGFFDFANSSALVVHPITKEMLAVIDLVLYRRAITPELTALVQSVSRAIESRIAERETIFHRVLHERFSRRTANHRTPALAMDRNGLIVAETGAVSSALGVTGNLSGRLASSIPALSDLAKGHQSSRPFVVSNPENRMIAAIEPVLDRGGSIGTFVFMSEPASCVSKDERRVWRPRFEFAELIGEHESFKSPLEIARKIARTDLPVLLTGETGTGKELVAHAIHNASDRSSGPFVAVNCASIPQELIASELLGYMKGAFTGASAGGMRGKFMQADRGTIFLDEITETSPAFQTALLRVLQDQEVVPIGSDRPFPVNVRVIAATNRDPLECLQRGAFRPDLYFRLGAVSIALPPLRERAGDLDVLIEHFLRADGCGKTVSAGAAALLRQYRWPGNVRELRSALQSAAAIADGDVIETEHLPSSIRGAGQSPRSDHLEHVDSMKKIESEAIRKALKASQGNVARAASMLGIGRSSLYRKLQQLD